MKTESGKYGELPFELGIFEVECKEMMFYQDMPIKMKKPSTYLRLEERLQCFTPIIDASVNDFGLEFGVSELRESYIYISAKRLFQTPGHSFNRPGWHSDGFMTNDINYIWCDKDPTIFNKSDFNLPLDDLLSMEAMGKQALPENDVKYKENQLLRLNQFNVHKVAPVTSIGLRTFLKISFSREKYNLIGNTHNYLLEYDWDMKERSSSRNMPQSNLKPTI